jgi:phage terminase small subunit
MSTTASGAPRHLSRTSRTWYRTVLADFDLEPHHIRLLQLAAEAWDRGQEARQLLAESGAVIADRFGVPRAHPAVAIERDSRIAFARLIRELDLDGEPGPDPRPRRL